MNNIPLRYSGGKSVMSTFFENIVKYNSLENVVYAEPYAGGAGYAINLLSSNKIYLSIDKVRPQVFFPDIFDPGFFE